MNVWHYNRAGAFRAADIDGVDCPDDDWEKWLGTQGWHRAASFPWHQQHDTSAISAVCFRHSASGRFLSEIYLHDHQIALLYSDTPVEFLLLLRDVILPLVRGGDADMYADALINAERYLFDPEHGLEPARRVKQREFREERERLDRRKRQDT